MTILSRLCFIYSWMASTTVTDRGWGCCVGCVAAGAVLGCSVASVGAAGAVLSCSSCVCCSLDDISN